MMLMIDTIETWLEISEKQVGQYDALSVTLV